MFEYISQHWYVGVILVVLIILTVFAWIKAISASKKHNDERDRIIAQLDREKELRGEFRHIDETTFAEGKDNYRLIIGMCAFVQMKIEKIPDMTHAFNELSEIYRFVYALGYVFEDSEKKLSEFFRSNGEPLLSSARQAVDSVIGGDFVVIFDEESTMLDDNDETTSVDNNRLAVLDENYKAFMAEHGEEIYKTVAEYIRANKSEFILNS